MLFAVCSCGDNGADRSKCRAQRPDCTAKKPAPLSVYPRTLGATFDHVSVYRVSTPRATAQDLPERTEKEKKKKKKRKEKKWKKRKMKATDEEAEWPGEPFWN